MWHNGADVADMVARAAAEDYEALVIAVDTAVFGRRERDVRHGYTPKLGAGHDRRRCVHRVDQGLPHRRADRVRERRARRRERVGGRARRLSQPAVRPRPLVDNISWFHNGGH